mgnify:CR=1 FL=1
MGPPLAAKVIPLAAGTGAALALLQEVHASNIASFRTQLASAAASTGVPRGALRAVNSRLEEVERQSREVEAAAAADALAAAQVERLKAAEKAKAKKAKVDTDATGELKPTKKH